MLTWTSLTCDLRESIMGHKESSTNVYGSFDTGSPNHTCTHMLNFALREVLGDHVDHKGSIVLPDKLRFDFSHGKPINPEHLRKIESMVNEQIKDGLSVYTAVASLSIALKINGLQAVFGEVFPDQVTVVSIGRKTDNILANPGSEEWLSISMELCRGSCGTFHVSIVQLYGGFVLHIGSLF